MFIVYVLKSAAASKSYVGVTNDINRRLSEHNSGRHFYTKRHLPWLVIHAETFNNFREARMREKYLKTAAGRRFLKKLFTD
ncbi:MAG: GIY-YIG nuclease family protein [Candidatus Liptonbacteria bacterium]|nr:GIY-YIG nuclease family protein [Candidatus Liptonbacteria bacterium]